MNDELLYLLTDELGKILQWEEECPGVYYLGVLPEDEGGNGLEYYAVFENAPISQEVRAMGRRLQTIPAWVYLLDSEEGPRWAVHYEVLKYKTMHDLPLPEGESLRDAALYGMEQCPDYFGTYPIPPQTPWGFTLRYRPAGQRNLLDRDGPVRRGAGRVVSDVGWGIIGWSPDDC